MESLSARSAILKPHSAAAGEAVSSIEATLSRMSGKMNVTYAVEGELAQLRIAPPRAPRFAEGLWQHTCFELFLRREQADAYHELNFSPSGEWALYPFDRYREASAGRTVSCTPATMIHVGSSTLLLKASIGLQDIDERYADAPLQVGVSAVIEGIDGSLSYWALAHPSTKPDFHHPDSFALRLP